MEKNVPSMAIKVQLSAHLDKFFVKLGANLRQIYEFIQKTLDLDTILQYNT